MVVHEMLKFAQDLTTCRKIAFARVSLHPMSFGWKSDVLVLLDQCTTLYERLGSRRLAVYLRNRVCGGMRKLR